MPVSRSCTLAALFCLCLGASLAWAEPAPDAATLHARGQAQRARGDFPEALASFRAAAAAAPQRADYARDAAVLKRVIRLRTLVAAPGTTAQWEKAAITLHAFYLRHRLHDHAQALDRRALASLANAGAEARLAETLLEADRPADALTLLSADAPWVRDTRHVIYRGMALARTERWTAAGGIADGLDLTKITDPLLLTAGARLEGLLGREARCAALLVRAFQGTPPANLATWKRRTRAHRDFDRVRAGPTFEKAMATASKLAPASCSGGRDCGSCPSRGGCGGAK